MLKLALFIMEYENQMYEVLFISHHLGMTWGLFSISWMMYTCLVHYTGAAPAEYYSVKKRPDYVKYQKTVNMFIPGPRKSLAE